MAITGISAISGEQIIAAGAVSAKSAEMAYNDENGNPITGYQIAGDYYSASNPSGFVTSGELPTIAFQQGETLDTDYDGLKIVKSTANGNEHINLHKKSTDQWLIHGNLVPTSPGSNKYLITDDSGAMNWDNKSALAYDSAFEQSGGYITAYNGSAFKAGDEFPQSATEAIDVVTGGSANWNGTTETVSSNSASWGGSALPISAGPGIKLEMVNNTLVASNDETLLWSGTINNSTTAGAMSGLISNYKKIKILCKLNTTTNDAPQYFEFNVDGAHDSYSMLGAVAASNGNCYIGHASVNIAGSTISYTAGNQMMFGQAPTNNKNATIYEVVGINRIAGV